VSYELDAELAPAMAALAARAAEAQAPARGDWQAVRTAAAAGLAYESIAYASGLAKAGVPVELHVHPGAPHGFERFVPDAGVAQRAMADRTRAVAAI
jgi:acetyl esterase/lipase